MKMIAMWKSSFLVTSFICFTVHTIAKTQKEKHKLFYHGKHGNYSWPRKDTAVNIPGDIVLGALHMVHERSEVMTCGPIMAQGGVQALETMLYTLDKINNELNLIPGVKFGILSKDDCDRDIYGLEQSVDFIRGSIANIGDTGFRCEDGQSAENYVKIIPGVIGAPSSVTSIQVATLLKLFKIPQVSFFSTSPVLSSRERYPYFLRTIPSDVNQAQVMVELVKMFQWKYISVVYEESSYGIQGFNEVEKLLKQYNVCIANTEKLPKDSGQAGDKFYDDIVRRLKKKINARGVIVFASDQEVGELMKSVRRQNATGQFSWIGSDGWGGRELAYHGKEPEVEGAVTVQPLAYEVQGFREYFLNLRPQTNTRNPWFIEFWEQQFHCKYPNSSWTPYNEDFTVTCSGNERIREEGFDMEAQLQFVSDSLMAFAYAFKGMYLDLCGGQTGLCPEMDPVDGEILKQYLLQVKFTGLSGLEFEFLPNGDGPANYRILNFKQTSSGVYEWQTVGFFRKGKMLDMSNLQYRLTEKRHPESVCSKPCEFGQAKHLIDGDICCWTCFQCHKYQYLPTEFECIYCPLGTLPSSDLKNCSLIDPIYLQYSHPIAIVAMVFASLGMIATCFVATIFALFNNTPVVKASGRELSFVILLGVMMCYSLTFIIVSKPSPATCGAQKLGIGLCFSVIYASILTKTNRIARIFWAGKRTIKRPKFISPRSQLIICGAFVSFQNAVGIVWLLLSPPEAVSFYANRDDHQLVCKDAVGAWYMIGFTYPIILITICTFYAIATRNIPEAFNESKFIGFTMYTTCIIWLAFVTIYFSTPENILIRNANMCFSISLSASVVLTCMFTPKLYILLLHPEQNVRQNITGVKQHVTPVVHKVNNYSACKPDGSIMTDDSSMELTHRLRPCGSLSSFISRSTSATQTLTNGTGHSISTQTLDMIANDTKDVSL